MMLLSVAFFLATECNTKKQPKFEEQLQALYKVVKAYRMKLSEGATPSNIYCNKKVTSYG